MKLRHKAIVTFVGVLAVTICLASSQAIAATAADSNLLSGMPATGTSYEPNWLPETVTDGNVVVTGGVQSDWVATTADLNPRVAVWGFNSAIDTIRVWVAGDLDPDMLEIKSSTSLITPTTGTFPADLTDSYETVLLPMAPTTAGSRITAGMAGDQPWQMWYWEHDVNAPAGTQSLLFDCGTSGRTRIVEIQAFAPIPEPSTLALLATGLIGLLACTRRKFN